MIIGSVVSLYAYFKVVWQMFAPKEGEQPVTPGNSMLSWIPVAVGVVGVLLLGLLPQAFVTFISALGKH